MLLQQLLLSPAAAHHGAVSKNLEIKALTQGPETSSSCSSALRRNATILVQLPINYT
jgi:hypothetical protein